MTTAFAMTALILVFCEVLPKTLAIFRDRVDGLAAGARPGARLAGDRAFALQAPQRRVQGAVGHLPQPAELLGELSLELVAVHRVLLQESEVLARVVLAT